MEKILTLECCGDCPFYDRFKEKCRNGAETYTDGAFFDDCPLDDKADGRMEVFE